MALIKNCQHKKTVFPVPFQAGGKDQQRIICTDPLIGKIGSQCVSIINTVKKIIITLRIMKIILVKNVTVVVRKRSPHIVVELTIRHIYHDPVMGSKTLRIREGLL